MGGVQLLTTRCGVSGCARVSDHLAEPELLMDHELYAADVLELTRTKNQEVSGVLELHLTRAAALP